MEGNLPGALIQDDGDTRFRVWAPKIKRVELCLVDQARPHVLMSRVDDGYHEVVVAGLPPRTTYFYRLNGALDRPDPASRFQPQGVHGPSGIVPRDFPWTDSAWHGVAWQDYVIYEAHVGTMTPAGTFAAIVGELDDLVRLGVTALQLMPVAQFPGGRNWGYDAVHPFAVQNTYGGPQELKKLIDVCHARGLAVVLDVVYNHLGPEGNYLAEFGPYFTDTYRTPWGLAINFDGLDSGPVRDFFIANARQWFEEFHVDGLRLDATHAIHDESPCHFLRELADQVHALSARLQRPLILIAESNANDPRVVRCAEHDGHGIDAQIVDDFHRALHARLTGERQGFYTDFGSLQDVAKAYQDGFVLTGRYSRYRHRPWGAEPSDIPPERFVAYTQCHDSVGNRPDGERLGRLVTFDELKLAAAVALLSPCTPMLFMGEEYDEPAPFYYFVSHLDPRLAAAVRAGRLREFAAFNWPHPPPDPQSTETFVRSRLTRSLANEGRHQVLWSFYQELLRLRKALPEVRAAAGENPWVQVLEDRELLVARRNTDAREVCLLFHFGDRLLMLGDCLPEAETWSVVLDSSDSRWQDAADQPRPEERGIAKILRSKSCVVAIRDR